ncbi:IS1182 family transposase [Paenibacillus cremeus]|uniref:IS1182 family transposase n=1 Tax=Paenibacillus cremeus TaxID=2163881 RepID=A0A559JAZ5_9BACL|nr:IS1182 family transposase [Paenibacillus cremeus]TVX97052.1 IS1182 family transposase [Paenibacillus cremeus]
MLRNHKEKQISGFDQYYYDKAVPQNHLLRRIAEHINFSFIRDLLAEQYSANRGRPAEEPVFLFKICLLEYLYNLSDVQVINHIQVNLAYRWFLDLNIDDELPDDTTISYFRVQRVGLEKFQDIFQRLVDQCIEQGFISTQSKRSIMDSTHIIADVAIPTWLSLVRQAYERVLIELREIDPEIFQKFENRMLELWTELKGKTRDEKLPVVLQLASELVVAAGPLLQSENHPNEALTSLKKVISDRDEDATDRIISVVDTEARTGHKSDMRKIQGYKDHIMMDEETEIITAVKVTPANAEDGDQLVDLITQFQDNYGFLPKELSADKGYWFGKNLRFLQENSILGHISWMKTKQQVSGLFTPEDFQFDAETMQVTCPHGVVSKKFRDRTKEERKGYEYRFTKTQCQGCPLRAKCTTSKTVRNVFISTYYAEFQQAREHYKTDAYKAASKQRWLIERRHADKVRNHGLRRSRYRGLERTYIHSLMSTIASNVKRMTKLIAEKRQRDQSALLVTS